MINFSRKWFFLVAGFIAILACLLVFDRNSPIVNNQPKKNHLIEIRFNNNQNRNLTFSALYVATNKKCDGIYFPSGASKPKRRIRNTQLDVNLKKTVVNVTADYYEPGVCNWQLFGISVNTKLADDEIQAYSVSALLPEISSEFRRKSEMYCSYYPHLQCNGIEDIAPKFNDFSLRRIY